MNAAFSEEPTGGAGAAAIEKPKKQKDLRDLEGEELKNRLMADLRQISKAAQVSKTLEDLEKVENELAKIDQLIYNQEFKNKEIEDYMNDLDLVIQNKQQELNKDTQTDLDPTPQPDTQDLLDIKAGKKYDNLEQLKKNADAIYLTKDGSDDKYVFVMTSPNIPTDMTLDTKDGARARGKNYYGIEIIGDFYSHNTIKDGAGKEGADIIIVPKYEDIKQQHQNYINSPAKQFLEKIGGRYVDENPKAQTDDVNAFVSLKDKIDNAKSKEEIEEIRKEIAATAKDESLEKKQVTTLRRRATRRFNQLPSAPESTKQSKQGSVADSSADVDKINAAAEKLNQVVDGDDDAVEAIKDMDLNSNELKTAVQSIVDDAMGDEAKKAKVKQVEPEIKDLAADAKGNDGSTQDDNTPFDSLFNKMAMAKSKEELQNVAREVETAVKMEVYQKTKLVP